MRKTHSPVVVSKIDHHALPTRPIGGVGARLHFAAGAAAAEAAAEAAAFAASSGVAAM